MAASMYEIVAKVEADGKVPVTKYKSKTTGITVIIAQVEGPLVNGYFCLATEAHDDDGLPHTLEHLVFMGSDEYPYKGVLDLLANRCLASGTNAWTDTDHTCYTMTNAGSEGFLNLLPIYLDHILYPTITEAGYITEVHHVNGDGEDAGVVYCEMQARENSGESRTHLELTREMYPGHCGYKSETGGIMKNLRESTSHQKVCSYHKSFYRPENLCLIITGQINPEAVFEALKPLDQKVASKGGLPAFSRPWQSPVPPLPESVRKVVKYSSDDETHGMVSVAWRGPPAKDQYTFRSLSVLFDYLSDSAVSPLQRDFVEIEDPFCSQVHCSMMENSECCIYFKFSNVPKEKLSQVTPRLMNILDKLSAAEEKIDMKRVNNVIHRRILESLSNMEDSPHDTMALAVIGDFLYSDTKQDLESRVQNVACFKLMKTETETYWINLIKKFLVGTNSVVIIGEPSKALMEEMAKTEADRVAQQRESLGEKGLKEKADILENATEENEKEAPDSLLTKVDVPNVSSIFFHPIKPSSNRDQTAANQSEKFSLGDIPFRFRLDDIHTNFVQINALLDTSGLPQDLKYYLPLFCQVLFESPVLRNGELVSHEAVVAQLEADTLKTEAGVGVMGHKFNCGNIPQLVHIVLKVEEEKYETGVRWLQEILYKTRFTAERLKIVAKKMSNDISEYKRKGNTVVRTLIRTLVFTSDCNHHVASMLRQQTFLNKLAKQLEDKPESVEAQMEEVRKILTAPDNLVVHLSADVARLTVDKPHRVWLDVIPTDIGQVEKSDVMRKTCEYVKPMDSGADNRVIVGVGSVESSYLVQAVPCISSYTDPDLAAVEVFIQYLTQLEGPMWRQIRGLGLSYHYSLYTAPESGLLYFLLARSTHIVNAYKEGRSIVMGYVTGKTSFSETELESAKSSLTFEVIEKEKTVSDVSLQSLLSYFRDVSHTYNKEYLQKIAAVSIEDLKRVGKKHIAPLFDVSRVRCAVCCNPSKVEEVTKGFTELGLQLKQISSLSDDSLSAL